jgi:hypothetical protein
VFVGLTIVKRESGFMMTAKEFEEQLVALLHREPFQPFIVEYEHGDRFEVDARYVSHSGGAAGYIDPDGELFLFDWRNVRQFIQPASEARK